MQAAVLTGPGRLDLVERPEPPIPGPGEVLVAVRRVGICGTDYHAYGGTQNFIAYPCVLGHELAVEVLEVGPRVTLVRPGDLCAVMPYRSCGGCTACLRRRTNCCERIQVLGVTRDGGLQERMVLSAVQLYHHADLTLDQLVLVETLGIGWHAVARARPEWRDDVLVLGAGPIGLAVAQSARQRVAHVLVADVSPHRVEFAVAAGLEAVVVDDDFDQVLRERGNKDLPSVVFDASGSRASMEAAFDLVGSGGTLVFVGHTKASLSFRNPGFHARELDLRASRNATPEDWAQVMTAVADGDLDAAGWVNHRTSLKAVVEDLPRLAAGRGQVVKAVVDIGPTGDGGRP
ncbi:alcohol dehydrogenase catalytic domain-containing protein [Streptosporangiaceae bacterium NEAU-GS5]|nr:alcohol dehydrogenase catalytic domain-containing protein [Streptosporangiaceae bacterium NEAU-GS5]